MSVRSLTTRVLRGTVFVALVTALAIGAWWWLRTPVFSIGVNPDRNVLLVTIDTLRADVLGSYGGRALTPNLDRLAARPAWKRYQYPRAGSRPATSA